MITFKEEHVVPVLVGKKTQTRRLGQKRWKVGGQHRLYRSRWKPPFAVAEILEVRQELLTDISGEDLLAEGYSDREEFFEVFCRIYALERDQLENLTVWVVGFKIIQAFEGIRHERIDTTAEKPRRRLAD